MNCRKITLLFSLLIPFSDALAEQKEVQDMSDPLAVYTQVGAGATNKGINRLGKLTIQASKQLPE